MTDQELDRILRRAMLAATEEAFRDVLDAPDTLPPASPRHERSMQRMCRDPLAWARRQARPIWQQALRTAAMLALACALAFAALLTASPEARARVKNWFVEYRDRDVFYNYTGDSPEGAMPRYVLSDIPDEYTLESIFAPDGGGIVEYLYRNADGQHLIFSYVSIQQGSAVSFDTDKAVVTDVTVHGCPGLLIEPTTSESASNALTWVDEDLHLQFTIDGCMSLDELCEIARSVRKK